MSTRAFTAFVVSLLAVSVLWAAGDKPTEGDDKILALGLKRSYSDGGYTVVSPETRLFPLDAKQIKQSKQYIAEQLQTNAIVVSKLIDQLLERNREPVWLTLKSSLKDGYVIDFNGKYARYFEKDGGGWEKCYKENSKAHGNLTVSRPAYDQKSGLVLVYTGTQSHWLAGLGWIILYRYEKGDLKELNKVMLWIS